MLAAYRGSVTGPVHGEPVHLIAQHLGHSDVQIILNTYAHVLPGELLI